MNPAEKEEIIGKAEFFRGLKTPLIRALADIALVKSLKKGDCLFHEGDRGNAVFVLASGSIQISKMSPDGKEIVIKLLQPSEVFGEVILFEQREYPAQAAAVTDSEVLMLSRHQIDCLFLEKEFRDGFIGMLMNKLRYLTGRILTLASHDVQERFFIFLHDHYGIQKEYDIQIPKKDIAAAIGTNPETFSRLIAKLEKQKVISWKGKKLVVIEEDYFP